MTDRVLLLDDDADHSELLSRALSRLGYAVDVAETAADAYRMCADASYSTVLTDLEMGETSGLEVCTELHRHHPNLPIIVVTGYGSVETVSQAMRAGAFDYVLKPVNEQDLGLRVARAVRQANLVAEIGALRGQREGSATGLRGNSAPMRHLQELVERVAATPASVLIQGESGTGKELVARALHEKSPRASGPFVAINCAAVPAGLLESELFGHARGAFTDAKTQREGLFVMASGGTLFLDEIGEMPIEMQSKLLRALQERKVRPVGSATEIPFDVRVIAATHRDLEAEIAAKNFRQDLYYRINVVRIDVPALRERRSDVLALASHFMTRACARLGRPTIRLSVRVAELLTAYDWPGNVRELENCMERLAALSKYDETMPEDLPDGVRVDAQTTQLFGEDRSVMTLEQLERAHIEKVLVQVQGNKSRAAQLLGMDRRTIYRKLAAYEGLDPSLTPPPVVIPEPVASL